MKMVRYAKTGNIMSGIAFIVCGLVLALFPSFSLIIISRVIGAVIIINGIVRVIGYFSKDLYSLAFQFDLALGILSVIIGSVFMLHPRWLASVFPIILGVIILVNSLFSFQTSVDSKRFGLKYWWVLQILSFISSCLGIVILLIPFESAKVIMVLIGATIIFTGAQKIFVSLYTVVVSNKNSKKADYIDVEDYTFKEKGDLD